MKRRLLALSAALVLLLTCSAAAVGSETGAGTQPLSLEEVAARVETGSALCRAYDELIAAVDDVDRETAYEDLLEAHNDLTQVIWAYLQAGSPGAAMVLQEQQELLLQQLDDFKPDRYAAYCEEQIRPVRALRDQLIQGAQQLYLSLAAIEPELARGRLSLTRLERALEDTQLLSSLGRASVRACEEAESARSAAERQLEELLAQREALTAQLQFLMGETPTGALSLAPVPEVTAEQLAGLTYEADLEAGLANDCGLFLAQNAADNAKEDWEDAEHGFQKTAAEHTYYAAVYTRDAEEQQFRQAFDAVSRNLAAARRADEAAQEALTDRQKAYDAETLRHQLGRISERALLDAGAALDLARLDAEAAKIGLSAAFHSYCWAKQGLITDQT